MVAFGGESLANGDWMQQVFCLLAFYSKGYWEVVDAIVSIVLIIF